MLVALLKQLLNAELHWNSDLFTSSTTAYEGTSSEPPRIAEESLQVAPSVGKRESVWLAGCSLLPGLIMEVLKLPLSHHRRHRDDRLIKGGKGGKDKK